MRRSDFHFDLPAGLIAQRPSAQRGDSRLLCLEPEGGIADRQMRDFPTLVGPDDLVVFNDTRVIPARLFGEKSTGGRVEILVERLLGRGTFLAQLRASKPSRPGATIAIDGAGTLVLVEAREPPFYRLKVEGETPVLELLNRAGHIPLPPYIDRPDEGVDRERYQTLFAQVPGAVAAPTAGLHFDEALINGIRARGAQIGTLTLHVGAGTFQPMRSEETSAHRMHRERYIISETFSRAFAETRRAGGRIIAIGTTCVRALESAATGGPGGRAAELKAGENETQIFITPGYRFRAVDALLTNFHLPESTLLMLVSAFAGHTRTMAAYAHAVRKAYRFFSYGDAMWIPAPSPDAVAD